MNDIERADIELTTTIEGSVYGPFDARPTRPEGRYPAHVPSLGLTMQGPVHVQTSDGAWYSIWVEERVADYTPPAEELPPLSTLTQEQLVGMVHDGCCGRNVHVHGRFGCFGHECGRAA